MKRTRALFLSTTLLVLACFCVSGVRAQVSDLTVANAFYNTAESQYNNGSYADALISAQRAFALYSKTGELPGIQKTTSLIEDIKLGLGKEAKSKYDQAWQFYTQGEYNKLFVHARS
jgi:hypothetical protein